MDARRLSLVGALPPALACAWMTIATGFAATPPAPDKQRSVGCMNYFKDHLQQLSGTPFVKECLRTSEPIEALAARLQASKLPRAPVAAPGDVDHAATSLYRDCERSRWGQHFACDCMRDAYVKAKAAHPDEPDFKLQERIAPDCLSEDKIRRNVEAECLRDSMRVSPQDLQDACRCEAVETYDILRSEPLLVLSSAGNRQLLERRGRACSRPAP